VNEDITVVFTRSCQQTDRQTQEQTDRQTQSKTKLLDGGNKERTNSECQLKSHPAQMNVLPAKLSIIL